ncbi:hypothetical protein [Aliarcobacter cryaerophilus]|uniref:hypothetical protein n=1 Tax=Aliarcobacter cryaerophilus TaxID=28198 RepID=UPI000835793F|nr:hypothetical protein [Aliarcobacter cryaerophilus]
MRNIELKIIYNFFIIFFYIGGGISSLLIDYTDIVMPQSGIKAVTLNTIGLNVHFIIVYLLTVLTILLINTTSERFKTKYLRGLH